MPASPAEETITAPWWPELLAVKDQLSWAALSKRFGVGEHALRRALADAGVTKAALPPGRKPKVPPETAPPAAESAPIADEPATPSPLDRHRAQMGKAPDAEIAELAGVSVSEVKAYRRAHGIAAFLRPPPVGETPARVEPAEAAPARRRAPGAGSVVRRRRNGEETDVFVPGPPPAPEAAPESPESHLEAFRDQLGQVADGVIAERAGVDRNVVGAYRRKHGIPAYAGFRFQKGVGPPKAPGASAGRASAPKSADATPKGRPGRKSALDAHMDILGKVTDAEVAAQAGVTVAAVTQYRRRRGIPSATAARAALEARLPEMAATGEPPTEAARPETKAPRLRASKLDPYAHLIGALPDAEVARRAGASVENVRLYRKRRGIPSTAGRGPAPSPVAEVAADLVAKAVPEVTAAPSAAAVVGVERQAFGVVAVSGQTRKRFVVVGTDMREAVARACDALDRLAGGPWTVLSVRHLAGVLG